MGAGVGDDKFVGDRITNFRITLGDVGNRRTLADRQRGRLNEAHGFGDGGRFGGAGDRVGGVRDGAKVEVGLGDRVGARAVQRAIGREAWHQRCGARWQRTAGDSGDLVVDFQNQRFEPVDATSR